MWQCHRRSDRPIDMIGCLESTGKPGGLLAAFRASLSYDANNESFNESWHANTQQAFKFLGSTETPGVCLAE